MLHARFDQLTRTLRQGRFSRRAVRHAVAAGIAAALLITSSSAQGQPATQPLRARFSTSGIAPCSSPARARGAHGDPGVRTQRHRGSLGGGAEPGGQNDRVCSYDRANVPGAPATRRIPQPPHCGFGQLPNSLTICTPCLLLPPFLDRMCSSATPSAVSSSGCTPPRIRKRSWDSCWLTPPTRTTGHGWRRRLDPTHGHKPSSSSPRR